MCQCLLLSLCVSDRLDLSLCCGLISEATQDTYKEIQSIYLVSCTVFCQFHYLDAFILLRATMLLHWKTSSRHFLPLICWSLSGWIKLVEIMNVWWDLICSFTLLLFAVDVQESGYVGNILCTSSDSVGHHLPICKSCVYDVYHTLWFSPSLSVWANVCRSLISECFHQWSFFLLFYIMLAFIT